RSVGAEALDVAALALGVDRVEGQAGLAGPGESGDADERAAREPDGDVLEVVLPGAVNDKLVGCHGNAIVATERTFDQALRAAPPGPTPREAAGGAHRPPDGSN